MLYRSNKTLLHSEPWPLVFPDDKHGNLQSTPFQLRVNFFWCWTPYSSKVSQRLTDVPPPVMKLYFNVIPCTNILAKRMSLSTNNLFIYVEYVHNKKAKISFFSSIFNIILTVHLLYNLSTLTICFSINRGHKIKIDYVVPC